MKRFVLALIGLASVTSALAALYIYQFPTESNSLQQLALREHLYTAAVSGNVQTVIHPQEALINGVVFKKDVFNRVTRFFCTKDSPTPKNLGMRAWAYEWTGNEPEVWDGRRYISEKEIEINPFLARYNNLETFKSGNSYDWMAEGDVFYKCGEGITPMQQCGNAILEGSEECDDGNTSDFDGCSSDCKEEPGYKCTGDPSECEIILPMLPPNTGDALLLIEQLSTGTMDATVENAKNINLMRFVAKNPTKSDMFFIAARFTDAQSALNLRNMRNFALWVDANQDDGIVDTILEDDVTSAIDAVIFDGLAGGGFVIPAGGKIVFEVHGDVVSDLTTNQLQLSFDVEFPYIGAEWRADGGPLTGIQTNGNCSNSPCQIAVSTIPSVTWHLLSQGSFTVSQDTVPLRSRQALGGTIGEEVFRLRLHAGVEAIDVTDMNILVDADYRSIDRLNLYREGESEPFAAASIAGCGTDDVPDGTFCANMENMQLVIPKDAEVIVIVRPKIKSDTEGGISGDAFTLAVVGGSVNPIQARGVESSNTIDPSYKVPASVTLPTNTFFMGNPNVVVMSKITAFTNANPDANLSAVPIAIADIGKFKFETAPHSNSANGLNDFVLDSVIFNVTATNIELHKDGFNFFNNDDSTTTIPCTPINSNGTEIASNVSGSFLVQCTDLVASSVNTKIDQGASQIFVLQANIINPVADGSSTATLQVSLQNFDKMKFTSFGPSAGHIHWYDLEGTLSSSTPSFYWIEFPTTSVNSTTYQS